MHVIKTSILTSYTRWIALELPGGPPRLGAGQEGENPVRKSVGIDGFVQDFGGAEVQEVAALDFAGYTGEENNGGFPAGGDFLQALEGCGTVEAAHDDIKEDEVGPLAGGGPYALLPPPKAVTTSKPP